MHWFLSSTSIVPLRGLPSATTCTPDMIFSYLRSMTRKVAIANWIKMCATSVDQLVQMRVQDMAVAPSAADESMDPDCYHKAASRLREVLKERQLWVDKREELLKRKEELLKLLRLQDPQYEPEKVLEEATSGHEPIKETNNTAGKALVRKEELKDLQARAEAAQVKQQTAASILANKLKQLLAKRKRDDKETNEPPRKKIDVGRKHGGKAVANASKLHPFAPAPDLSVETTELAKATCFRIATRYFVQTGVMMSRQTLALAFETYTGKVLEEVIRWSLLEHSLATLVAGDTQNLPKFARKTSVCWQPGRQFLRTPTFISSTSGRIRKMIDLEKDVVASVCDPSQLLDNMDSKISAMLRRRRQRHFLANALNKCATVVSPTMLLCAFLGVNSARMGTGNHPRVYYRLHAQLADVLKIADTWLCEQAEVGESSSSFSPMFDGQSRFRETRERVCASKYDKPFSVANDSVVRQLKGGAQHPNYSRTIDPMKIMCRYELNGVCNDKSCSDYHQKDYELDNGTRTGVSNSDGEHYDDASGTVEKMDEMDQLMVSFAAFRARIMVKWPIIVTSQTLSTTAKPDKDTKSTESALPTSINAHAAVNTAQDIEERSGNNCGDFIALHCQEELPSIGHTRYYDDVNSRKLYGEMLQAKVKEIPTATDAWLLLAIFQLELVVGLSDDDVNVSDDDYLQQQLLLLCKELNLKQRNSTSSIWAVEESNLKRCLHTLSRALEVEANAYCEALWLLYLHLCKQVTSRQTEIDMVEQGVQFLPNSHALWLRYISTYEFESVSVVEGIHWRLLEHLARTNIAGAGSELSKLTRKNVSILLTAISFHLCIKLWHAGATERILGFLSALLQLGDQPSEFAWCCLVRDQLRRCEIIVFCLVFAHFLIFNEIPELIEHWVAASNSECIPIKELAYAADNLQDSGCNREEAVLSQALRCYELAYQTFEKGSNVMHDAGNIILSNWMHLLALQRDDKKTESLSAFFLKYTVTIRQFPGASLIAAKLMGLESTGNQEAQQLMLTMMNQSSNAHFSEALHHYLFACRQLPALVDALDQSFPDIMERLAGLVDANIEHVKSSIQNIMHITSKIEKSWALKNLLEALLGAWMNQLAMLRHETAHCTYDDKQRRSDVDIYVALDICYLMSVLLETSVAVDGLQKILCSSTFPAVKYEARQLAWAQRFVFQVDLLRQEVSKSSSWRQSQAKLIELFRKYMLAMSGEAEMMRQVSRRIKTSIANSSVEDAVCDCLNLERRQLFTGGANLELFWLCVAAMAGPDKAAFYASWSDVFALSPKFSLAFSEIATHEWELLAARTSLRKCLSGAKTNHFKVLQALVAVELRLNNTKAVAKLLKSEIQVNPLRIESWRLAVALEILVGDTIAERSQRIADEIEKRQLVFTCNTFGDDQIANQTSVLWGKNVESLSLRGLGLEHVPTAVLLCNELVSLDISGNELLELPMGLRHLANLQQLDASENALLEFPACIRSLPKLKELRLAHNNITTLSIPELSRLNRLDIRWNTAAQLPASSIVALTSLKILQAEENLISLDDLSRITDLLLSRENVVSPDVLCETAKLCLDEQQELNQKDPASVQPARSNLTKSFSIEVSSQKEAGCLSNETSSIVTKDVRTGCATIDAAGDQRMGSGCTRTASYIRETTKILKEVDITNGPKKDEESIVGDDECSVPSVSKELHGDHNTIQEEPVPASNLSATLSTPINNAADYQNPCQQDSESKMRTMSAVDSTDILPTTTVNDLCTVNITELNNFAQNCSEVTASTAARRRDEALLARKRLATYMDSNHIANRADVRDRNPSLWREFLAATLPLNFELPACRLCFAPNDGYNQRFNCTVLCVRCLEEAILLLKERKQQSEGVKMV